MRREGTYSLHCALLSSSYQWGRGVRKRLQELVKWFKIGLVRTRVRWLLAFVLDGKVARVLTIYRHLSNVAGDLTCQ